ncbi:MAG: iron-sulfur binding hydrogenase [Kosmotogaceae bacterium]|nr:iron-sulfur binding hydrogenase [Kosmotogaceae bacterium]
MKLNDLVEMCGIRVITSLPLDTDISNAYIGDLLSDVMGNAPANSIWLTVQSHMNILAVASIVGARAIVLCNGLHFEESTVRKAEETGIVLLESDFTTFDIAVKLVKCGLGG